MTADDHDPQLDDGPLDDDTLAVHAVVDDDATPEQRRRVARDPALVAQVAALRSVVAAVAEPVASPGDDLLAAIRSRAIDAALADTAPATDEPAQEPPVEEPAPAAAPPVRDLGEVRARKVRRLPPLPAVAAVVILLVIVGVGLLVSGGTDDEDSASSSDTELSAGGGDDGGDSGGGTNGEAAAEDAGPSDAIQEELLSEAVARYDDDDELLADLRRVDVDALDIARRAQSTDGAGGGPETTTTTPETTFGGSTTAPDVNEGEATSTTTPANAATVDGRSPAAYASDPDVQRCDSVLRSAERDIEPVIAAVLVDVAGTPVLILSNPIEVSDQAPAGVRLTALNAIDCSPRGYAVVR